MKWTKIMFSTIPVHVSLMPFATKMNEEVLTAFKTIKKKLNGIVVFL